MALTTKGYVLQSATVAFVAGDASKVIIAAPGVGKFINVVRANLGITISAAQTIDIESAGGVTEIIKTGVSPAVGSQYPFASSNGVRLPENTALSYVPAGAGNAGLVAVDYFIDGTF